jgi:hydroxymethylpyrimidine/phosphomethylpyrimidine kinase
MDARKNLLTVAGFDPVSGAGLSLDLKVFSRYGYYGMAVVTSLTVQNTMGVRKIHCPPARFVREQYEHLRRDVRFCGIKVGMLGCKENVRNVARILSDNPRVPSVIDPVFESGSGYRLIGKTAIPFYMGQIKGKASILTPNLPEAEWISGLRVRKEDEMLKAAEKIHTLTLIPCLIKGGHLEDRNVDILFDGNEFKRYRGPKLEKTVHGTGCYLSSAILCFLASGMPLEKAVSSARRATRAAIKQTVRIGKGQEVFSL